MLLLLLLLWLLLLLLYLNKLNFGCLHLFFLFRYIGGSETTTWVSSSIRTRHEETSNFFPQFLFSFFDENNSGRWWWSFWNRSEWKDFEWKMSDYDHQDRQHHRGPADIHWLQPTDPLDGHVNNTEPDYQVRLQRAQTYTSDLTVRFCVAFLALHFWVAFLPCVLALHFCLAFLHSVCLGLWKFSRLWFWGSVCSGLKAAETQG